MLETLKKEWQAQVAIVLFLLFTLWWLYNNFVIGNEHIRYDTFFDFGGTYGLMALWGGLWGLIIAKKWGGMKSVMGKALIFFSLGLFAQEFGQLFYALYNDIYKTPGPYPSLGDLGFFGSIFLYTYGIILLAKVSGVSVKLQSYTSRIQAIIIPLIMLVVGYYLFMQGYEFDWSNPIKVFLDFGYPFGQAFYISIAILTVLLSQGVLGGVMKGKIFFILLALLVQFLSDYTFLYQSSKGLWQVGGINDYMYFVAYFLMTIGLLQLGTIVTSLRKE